MKHMYESVFNVKELGAVGDGVTKDTPAVRRALGKVSENGGGTVFFPPGTYLIEPVELVSNTTFFLSSGAVILGSDQIDDYFEAPFSLESPRIGLLFARHASNITLMGNGIVDFQGMAFMNAQKPFEYDGEYERQSTRQKDLFLRSGGKIQEGPATPLKRPGNLVQFYRCTDITIKDLHFKNAPNWTIHFNECDSVDVTGIRIENNPLIPNSDGIHLTSSHKVRISSCRIDAGDDCIAMTGLGEEGRVTRDVIVTQCFLSSRSSGIRVGHHENSITNCMFSHLVIHSNRGIGVFARDEGHMSDISFSHIHIFTRLHTGQWWGHGEPIHLSTGRVTGKGEAGTLKRIRFSDIVAQGESQILIHGTEESPIEDVTFNNVDLILKKGVNSDAYGGNVDIRPVKNIKEALFEKDEHGLYAKHVKGLTLNRFSLSWAQEVPDYFTSGLYLEKCTSVRVDGYKGTGARPQRGDKPFCALECSELTVVGSPAPCLEGSL